MKRRRMRHGLSTALSVGALAGLLIWTKLRLVSDLPRSAYAVPPEVASGLCDCEGTCEGSHEAPENPASVPEQTENRSEGSGP
ncbi:MAG: hypothetical protein ACIARR_12295 [Phycisphaerales bacterium JB059]